MIPARPSQAIAAALCAVVVWFCAVPSLAAQTDRGRRALAQWTAAYAKGRLDLTAPRIPASSPGVRNGIVAPERAQAISHFKELEEICQIVAEEDSSEAAAVLLDLTAAALGGGAVDAPEQMPAAVLVLADRTLDRLVSPGAIEVLEKTAADEGAGDEVRAAALRGLGRRADERFRPTLDEALKAKVRIVRLAAAEAVGRAASRNSLQPLCVLLGGEADDAVASTALDSMLDIVGRHRDAIEEDQLRRCADAAIGVLGRCTWRTDLVAARLLRHVRSAQSVPALIAVLERWAAARGRGDRGDDGRSGTLRVEVFETLKSLTGANVPMEDPERWRSWWESVKSTFEVQPVREGDSAGADPGRTVTADFFGIPVRGSRVLFIVDVSGSMAQPMVAKDDDGTSTGRPSGRHADKISAAKAELWKAVSGLTVDCFFNCVTFSNGAESWQRDMVEASPKVRQRFEKFVEKMRADGGTNLWEALRLGLEWKSMVYGERYGAGYDEVFVLSDGLPSVGEVQDPVQILRLVRETNRFSKLRINTVYISGPPELERQAAAIVGMSGQEFMRRLAEENGGRAISL
ncbi:MAG: HEAT repeat domain-containing protein [Planctomycetes bacterium]|nr:HEAT repeat domain-containing protein [Planctomycetota bacterium]